MGNFLSGAKARLIFNGRALSAGYLIQPNCRDMNANIISFSKEVRHAL